LATPDKIAQDCREALVARKCRRHRYIAIAIRKMRLLRKRIKAACDRFVIDVLARMDAFPFDDSK
jgi:hypothetical protein